MRIAHWVRYIGRTVSLSSMGIFLKEIWIVQIINGLMSKEGVDVYGII